MSKQQGPPQQLPTKHPKWPAPPGPFLGIPIAQKSDSPPRSPPPDLHRNLTEHLANIGADEEYGSMSGRIAESILFEIHRKAPTFSYEPHLIFLLTRSIKDDDDKVVGKKVIVVAAIDGAMIPIMKARAFGNDVWSLLAEAEIGDD
ncbi:hypothetical protein M011DRAFT_480826 [Sporormia fimetaria CBS 119925]|uniref:Uncharacterized protein n=1 Tax=Sporormia fimetaria CBS 119925 TaxID=1340428 RepID=A0A6A6V2H1_9PLEO|nr:hypothetical protein M011DRAFT_480826 [Sporormia fimetaria CBS 119925]